MTVPSLAALTAAAALAIPAGALGAPVLVAEGGNVGADVPASAYLGGPPGRVGNLPTSLPGAPARSQASRASWIVAARPGPVAERAARAVGAELVDRELSLFVAPESRAVRLVARLKAAGAFLYAEPNADARRTGLPADPKLPEQWWAPHVLPDPLGPPPAGGPGGIALIEDGADTQHPDLAHVVNARPPELPADPTDEQRLDFAEGLVHGTGVASVATAAANGVGLVGAWPGHTTRVYSGGDTCAGVSAAVLAAARSEPAVINMSYAFFVNDLLTDCFTHVRATQLAFGAGANLVAAAGNSLDDPFNPSGRRNPILRPASDPHVLTVGALNTQLQSTGFSQRSIGLDLVAPGEGIPVAVPATLDADGTPDGYTVASGTSFSAPIVAAQVAILRNARPGLSADQVNEVLRTTAEDLGGRGWDRAYGWGLIDLQAALTARAPRRDPSEPNDNIVWVDGRAFAKPDQPHLRKRSRETVRAALDYLEDPADVIPVSVPPRSTLLLDLRPLDSNVDLLAFDTRARNYTSKRGQIVAARRAGLRTERVSIDNVSGRRQKVYVVAEMRRGRVLSSEYVLRMRVRRTGG